MKIIANHHYREVLTSFDLTEKEAREFDYLDLENGEGSFFRYRGDAYDLGEFMRWITRTLQRVKVGTVSALILSFLVLS